MTRLSRVESVLGSSTAGYREVRSPLGRWIARADCAAALESGAGDPFLAGSGTRAAAPGGGRSRPGRLELGGRAAVAKRMLHGGLLGPLLGDLYLGRYRAEAQIALADRLRARGVSTPAILAAGARPRRPFLWALAVIAEEIPGARNLLEVARDEGLASRRLLERCADLVRAMHDAGFVHADLNVFNIVLERGERGERLHVVDLDKGRFVDEVLPAQRVAGLARLQRSYATWLASYRPLGRRAALRFLSRYCRGDDRLARDLAARLARRMRAGGVASSNPAMARSRTDS